MQRFGTRFSEFRAELDRVTLLQTPLHFHPWQDTKSTTQFATVLTATKARTRLRKAKLYTWVSPTPALTTPFFPDPFTLRKQITHYFWDRLRIHLFFLWAVRPVQSFSACTRVHFTFS
jgi:hypothetical protein